MPPTERNAYHNAYKGSAYTSAGTCSDVLAMTIYSHGHLCKHVHKVQRMHQHMVTVESDTGKTTGKVDFLNCVPIKSITSHTETAAEPTIEHMCTPAKSSPNATGIFIFKC